MDGIVEVCEANEDTVRQVYIWRFYGYSIKSDCVGGLMGFPEKLYANSWKENGNLVKGS